MSPGSSCTINVIFTPAVSGTRTGTLTITDNASGSPHTVSLSGTAAASTVSLSTSSLTFPFQIMVGTPSDSQPVTLTNIGTQTLTITGIVASGNYSEQDTCGGSLIAGANCIINVTLTPTATGALNGTLTITDDSNGVAGTTQTVTLTGSGFSGNAVPVNVTFGLPGSTNNAATNYFNAIFATVTVCAPGSTTCATIPNVLVDTGSSGLRVLSSIPGLTTQIADLNLPQISDGSGNNLFECVEYGDTSYTFGSVQLATLQIGGETAAQVPGQAANSGIPIQVITAGGTAPSGASCLSGGGPSNNSVAALGANGILGVANFVQDCGPGCAVSTTDSLYFLCSASTSNNCPSASVPLEDQVWNPVPAFASADTNGLQLQLPAISAAGQDTVAGSLIFGIDTQTCPAGAAAGCVPNPLGSAQLYALDLNGNFASIVFKTLTYPSSTNPSYVDSGSEAMYISDAATIGMPDCMVGTTNIFYYCPATTQTISNIGINGFNGVGSGTISVSIANALTLFSTNPTFAAFNNLAGDGGTGTANDAFDFGMPFFYGRTLYVGIEGATPPNTLTAPNGYFAF
jgi:hypothetical protein